MAIISASLPLVQLNHDLETLSRAPVRPAVAPKPAQAIVHVPAALGGDEIIQLSDQESVALETFQELIDAQAKHGDPFILARAVTQSNDGMYFVRYYAADNINYYLFLKDQAFQPVAGQAFPLTRNNMLLYHLDKSFLNPDGSLNDSCFYTNILPPVPIRLGVQYFVYSGYNPVGGFQYLCSNYDLFINTDYQRWHAIFQAMQNQDQKLKTDAKTFLQDYQKKHPLKRPEEQPSQHDKNSISIHVPKAIGQEEYLDPSLFNTFKKTIQENAKYDEPFILARVVTQNNGRYFVTYFDAHTLHSTLAGDYPGAFDFKMLSKVGEAGEQDNMLLCHVPHPYNNAVDKYYNIDTVIKEFYHNPANTLPLTRGIQYFTYNAKEHNKGFQYLCSDYDLFINPSYQYWQYIFYANQNSHLDMKQRAYNELSRIYITGKYGVKVNFEKGVNYHVRFIKLEAQRPYGDFGRLNGLDHNLRTTIEKAAKQNADKKLKNDAERALAILHKYEYVDVPPAFSPARAGGYGYYGGY